MSTSPPGMAAGDPLGAEPCAPYGAMSADGLQRILRATRIEATAAPHPTQSVQERPQRPPVTVDEEDQERFHAERGKIESLRARSNHSSRNSAKVALAAADLATVMTSQPGSMTGRCRRQISLSRRRVRLRMTAPPTRRDVISPNRVSPWVGSSLMLRRRYLPCTVLPSSRTSANSRPRRTRAARGKRSRLGFGMAGEVDFDTLWQQALAAALAAAAQNGAPTLGLHPRAKAKLLLPGALAGLVGAFHMLEKSRIGENGDFLTIVNPLLFNVRPSFARP